MKNPEVVNALNDPWNYAIDNLGWQLIPVTSKSVHIFWNQGLNAWVIHCKENLKLSEELWINHLLVSTEFSVYVVISFQGLLRLSLYQTSEKSYVATSKHLTVRIAFCDKCDRLAIEIEDEGVICSYCNGEKSYALPLAQREILQFDNIISNPRAFSDQQRQRVGLSLIALLAINKLSEDDRTFLYDHVSNKLTKRLGYQPLLILTGIDLLRSAQGASISIDSLLKKYKKWIDVIHHESIEKVLTNCLAYWLQKKWLKKVSTGFYLTLDVTNDVNTTD